MFRSLTALSLTAFTLVACGQAETNSSAPAAPTVASSSAEVSDASVAAVLIYADWCGSCQVLDPKVTAVREAGVDGARFVTLDYTDRDDAAFFAAADAAGVGPAIRQQLAQKVKTGQLLLVDLEDQLVTEVVTKGKSEAEIAAIILEQAATS